MGLSVTGTLQEEIHKCNLVSNWKRLKIIKSGSSKRRNRKFTTGNLGWKDIRGFMLNLLPNPNINNLTFFCTFACNQIYASYKENVLNIQAELPNRERVYPGLHYHMKLLLETFSPIDAKSK
jgi:hypothetical protein